MVAAKQPSIKLDSGVKRVLVENTDGHTHELVFNPNDVLFIERLHKLYSDANQKAKELDEFQKEIVEPELDENGVPFDIGEVTRKTIEINEWFRGEIDTLLGKGTSKAIYGDVVFYGESYGVYVQLVTQLMKYIVPVRKRKTDKYTAKKVSKKTSAKTKAS